MPYTARIVALALTRAGFIQVRQRGSHRAFVRQLADGAIQRVSVPMHGGDLPPGTLRGILRAADLTEADLRRLTRG